MRTLSPVPRASKGCATKCAANSTIGRCIGAYPKQWGPEPKAARLEWVFPLSAKQSRVRRSELAAEGPVEAVAVAQTQPQQGAVERLSKRIAAWALWAVATAPESVVEHIAICSLGCLGSECGVAQEHQGNDASHDEEASLSLMHNH